MTEQHVEKKPQFKKGSHNKKEQPKLEIEKHFACIIQYNATTLQYELNYGENGKGFDRNYMQDGDMLYLVGTLGREECPYSNLIGRLKDNKQRGEYNYGFDNILYITKREIDALFHYVQQESKKQAPTPNTADK